MTIYSSPKAFFLPAKLYFLQRGLRAVGQIGGCAYSWRPSTSRPASSAVPGIYSPYPIGASVGSLPMTKAFLGMASGSVHVPIADPRGRSRTPGGLPGSAPLLREPNPGSGVPAPGAARPNNFSLTDPSRIRAPLAASAFGWRRFLEGWAG